MINFFLPQNFKKILSGGQLFKVPNFIPKNIEKLVFGPGIPTITLDTDLFTLPQEQVKYIFDESSEYTSTWTTNDVVVDDVSVINITSQLEFDTYMNNQTLQPNTVYRVSNGTYNVTGQINLNTGSAIIGESKSGVVFKRMYNQGVDGRGVITYNNTVLTLGNFILDNFTIDGNKSSYNSTTNYGLFLSYSSNTTLNNLNLHSSQAPNLYNPQSSIGTVNNITGYNSSSIGVYFRGTYFNIKNLVSYNNTQFGIMLLSGFNTLENITTYGNLASGFRLQSNSNSINNLVSYNNSTSGFELAGNTNMLNKLSIYGNTQYGINVTSTSISGNKFYDTLRFFDNLTSNFLTTTGNDTYLSPGTDGLNGWLNGVIDDTDDNPNAFSFTTQTGVALNTVIESNTITVGGITTSSPISISGGEYSINSGSYTSVAGSVVNGDTVKVRHTSSSINETDTVTTLNIGLQSGTFTTTTIPFEITLYTNLYTLTDTQLKGIYGSTSSYSKAWVTNNAPSPENHTVVNITSQLEFDTYINNKTLQTNTIYKLSNGLYNVTGDIKLSTCSSIVGESRQGVILKKMYSSSNGFVQISNISGTTTNNIIYGITLDGNTSSYGGNGLSIKYSLNNTINNFTSYNCRDKGIFLESSSLYNLFNNTQTYNNNNEGIHLTTGSSSNILNSIQSFNNYVGVSMFGVTYTSISNSSVYNNYFGISFDGSSSSNVLNNVNVYKNYLTGILIGNSFSNKLNKCTVYGNYLRGIHTITLDSSNKYYNSLKVFGNGTNFFNTNGSDSYLSAGTDSFLSWTNGSIDTTGTFTSPEWVILPTWTSGTWSPTTQGQQGVTGPVTNYTYGINITTQIQPTRYNSTSFVLYGTDTKEYDTNKKIGYSVVIINDTTGPVKLTEELSQLMMFNSSGTGTITLDEVWTTYFTAQFVDMSYTPIGCYTPIGGSISLSGQGTNTINISFTTPNFVPSDVIILITGVQDSNSNSSNIESFSYPLS